MIKLYSSFVLFFALLNHGRALPVNELAAMHHLNESPVELADNQPQKPQLIVCKPEENGTIKPDTTNQGTFYKCQANGQPVEMHCPNGMVFNQQKSNCHYDEKQEHSDNNNNSSYDCNGKHDGFYGDQNDDNKFYECVNGMAKNVAQCPDNWKFVPEYTGCVGRDENKTTGDDNQQSNDQEKSNNRHAQRRRSPSHHQLEELAKEKHVDLHLIETTTMENFDVWID